MSSKVKIIGLVALVALLVTVAGATVAFAGDPQPPASPSAPMFGPAEGRGERGGRGFDLSVGHEGTSLMTVAAEQLGMTVEELVAELRDGKTIAQVAEEKGVSLDSIIDAYLAPRAEALEQAVADGRITQEQADRMLANMREMVESRLNAAFTPRGEGGCGDEHGDGPCDDCQDHQGDHSQGDRRGMKGGRGGQRGLPNPVPPTIA